MPYIIKKHLSVKLLDFYSKSLLCKYCNLPQSYLPQIGLIGKDYDQGGIIFMQINPGHISMLTEDEIISRYKRKRNQDIARNKVISDKEWFSSHKTFLKSPSIGTLNLLNQTTRKCIESWGWPQGKYIKVLEKHGAVIDSCALLNIAQCPVPGDKYNSNILNDCWGKNTIRLLDILKPGLIIAQGKQVQKFLKDHQININVIEGIHHASRISNSEKNNFYMFVRNKIAKFFTCLYEIK